MDLSKSWRGDKEIEIVSGGEISGFGVMVAISHAVKRAGEMLEH